MFDSIGSTGLCSLEIARTSKGDYTYSLKTYFSAKGRSPEAAIDRADKLRLEVERRLGLLPEIVAETDDIVTESDPSRTLAEASAIVIVNNRLVELGETELAQKVRDRLTGTPESVSEARKNRENPTDRTPSTDRKPKAKKVVNP